MIISLRYITGGMLRNCESMLAGGISASSTTLTVTSGEGVKFPTYFPFLLQCESEIMICDSLSTDTLTVQKGKKGTMATTHTTGTPIRAILYSNDLDFDRIVCDINEVVANENKVVYN